MLRMRRAILYLASAAVMTLVMVVMLLLGHLLIAALACLCGIAALLSAVGRLVAEPEDPDQ